MFATLQHLSTFLATSFNTFCNTHMQRPLASQTTWSTTFWRMATTTTRSRASATPTMMRISTPSLTPRSPPGCASHRTESRWVAPMTSVSSFSSFYFSSSFSFFFLYFSSSSLASLFSSFFFIFFFHLFPFPLSSSPPTRSFPLTQWRITTATTKTSTRWPPLLSTS